MNVPSMLSLSDVLQQITASSEYLLLGLSNGKALCDAYGLEPFQHAFLSAVHERLRPYGVTDQDITVVNQVLLLVGWSNTGLPLQPNKDLYLERIKAALCYEPVQCGSARIQINVFSSWLTLSPYEAPNSSQLRSLANAIAFSEVIPQPREQTRDDMALAIRFYTDMQSDKVVLSFQPVVSIKNRQQILYYEVLLRRNESSDAANAATSCAPVIQALERLHSTERLDASVLWTVLQLLKQDPSLHLACNISPLSLHDRTCWRLIASTLRKAPKLAARLTLEISETTAVFDLHAAAKQLNSLRVLGCKLAIATTGAGLNAFRLAKKLGPHVIKIHKTLLHQTRNQGSSLGFHSWLQLPRSMSQQVVAEGIETDLDLQLSVDAGVHAVQGNFITPPTVQPPWNGAVPLCVRDSFTPTHNPVSL